MNPYESPRIPATPRLAHMRPSRRELVLLVICGVLAAFLIRAEWELWRIATGANLVQEAEQRKPSDSPSRAPSAP